MSSVDANEANNWANWLYNWCNCTVFPMPRPWHSCYCPDPLLREEDRALNLPLGKKENYSSVARQSIDIKRENTFQGEWDHQHFFYKPEQILNIFLSKSPKQCIFCAQVEFFLLNRAIFYNCHFGKKKENFEKKHQSQLLPFPHISGWLPKQKPHYLPNLSAWFFATTKKLRIKNILEKLMICVSDV